MTKKEKIYLGLIVFLSAVLRFWDLGYSNFYGDETKLLYWNKTIPAFRFFLDQRKGPLQFLAVWLMEKITGGFSEFAVRFLFALAGLLSIAVFYFIIKKIFSYKVSLVSTLLFSISGFNVAFSRTAQYQSLLILFGLLSIYFAQVYFEKKNRIFLIASAISLGLSFWAHYDAVFYAVPLLYLCFTKYKEKELRIKNLMMFFVIPFTIVMSLFYLPYIYEGFFVRNTINYLDRRFSGSGFIENSSIHTYLVYNPSYLFLLPLFISLVVLFFKNIRKKVNIFLIWFLVPFISFQFIVKNPGTHIMHYFVPLYALFGVSVFYIYKKLNNSTFRNMYIVFLSSMFAILISIIFYVYLPVFNAGYPWEKHTKFINFDRSFLNYHLFLYGFPYDRGWDDISRYLDTVDGVRNIYTNDNDTIAQYYLKEYSYTPPGSNYLPQYYIHVYDNQEFIDIKPEFLEKYELNKKFHQNQKLVMEIYEYKN